MKFILKRRVLGLTVPPPIKEGLDTPLRPLVTPFYPFYPSSAMLYPNRNPDGFNHRGYLAFGVTKGRRGLGSCITLLCTAHTSPSALTSSGLSAWKGNDVRAKGLGLGNTLVPSKTPRWGGLNGTLRLNTVPKASKRDNSYTDNSKVVSITYEEIGLFPRSFSRVLDRFLKQLFSDVDNLVIGEYRFYRYLFLTTIKTILILFLVPFIVNFVSKNLIVKPLAEYFWNSGHPEIFLNSYEQKRAFAELERFEEKIYFEALVSYNNYNNIPSSNRTEYGKSPQAGLQFALTPLPSSVALSYPVTPIGVMGVRDSIIPLTLESTELSTRAVNPIGFTKPKPYPQRGLGTQLSTILPEGENTSPSGAWRAAEGEGDNRGIAEPSYQSLELDNQYPFGGGLSSTNSSNIAQGRLLEGQKETAFSGKLITYPLEGRVPGINSVHNKVMHEPLKGEDFYYSYNQSKNVFNIYGEKTVELATTYNNRSIEAITNFFADLLSLGALLYLLVTLEIQIQITKSFLAEVFFGLDDSKKSLLILLVTDLLVGYHSSNLWELFFGMIFNHYGIPESQTGIFLLVATLPVLLDVLFKYLIFRHLNRSSPATVATYQAMIE